MHKAILIMLLSVVSSSAMAEWAKVDLPNLKDGITHYVDLTMIIKAGNKAKMWRMIDIESAKAGDRRSSMITQDEFDCKEEKKRVLSMKSFHGNMGTGGFINLSDNKKPRKWNSVEPDSTQEVLWKIACGVTRPAAKWTRVHKNDELGLTLYADYATIRKSGDITKIWSMGDFETMQKIKMGGKKKKYLSSKSRWEFNCKENQLRLLASVFFSDNMSRGTRLLYSSGRSLSFARLWMQVETVGESLGTLLKTACGKTGA